MLNISNRRLSPGRVATSISVGLLVACSTATAPFVAPEVHATASASRSDTSPTPLRQDEFDTPAATSVAEAAKATQPVDHAQHEMQPMDHSTHAMTEGQPSRTDDAPVTKRSEPKRPTHGHTTTAPSKPRQSARDAAKPAASKPQTTAKPQPAAQAIVYTCPMHPEVTSDKPGSCPKCGMTLVKKK